MFLEVNNFLRNYLLYFAEEVEKILWKNFLVNKRKIQYNLRSKI